MRGDHPYKLGSTSSRRRLTMTRCFMIDTCRLQRRTKQKLAVQLWVLWRQVGYIPKKISAICFLFWFAEVSKKFVTLTENAHYSVEPGSAICGWKSAYMECSSEESARPGPLQSKPILTFLWLFLLKTGWSHTFCQIKVLKSSVQKPLKKTLDNLSILLPALPLLSMIPVKCVLHVALLVTVPILSFTGCKSTSISPECVPAQMVTKRRRSALSQRRWSRGFSKRCRAAQVEWEGKRMKGSWHGATTWQQVCFQLDALNSQWTALLPWHMPIPSSLWQLCCFPTDQGIWDCQPSFLIWSKDIFLRVNI